MSSMRQSRYLLVTNLPDCITEDRISDHFKRYGPVQSVTPQSSGCATVAFIDIRSAAKAFTSPDNLIDDHVIKTQYCEPPASSTASAIYIHDTRDDVLSRPATNSHNSSGSSTSSAVSVTGSAFPQSGGRSSGRHSLLTPATRSLSEDRLYERDQRTGSCNNYERSSYKQRLHHEEDLRSRIPRDRPYRSDRFSEGSDRKRRHLEVINKPVNSKDRTPEVRVEKTPKLVTDAADDVTTEEVVCRPGHQTTIITRIVNYGEHVDAVVVQEPSPASDHFSRRSLSSCKSGGARVACTPTAGKDNVPIRTVDAAVAVNLSLSDPRRLTCSTVLSSSINSSRLTADSAVDAESGIVTSTDSLPHDVYSSSHKNEDHGCEVSSSSDKPLVKTLTPNLRKESCCMSLPLPEFAAEKMLLELTSSSSSKSHQQQQQSATVAPFTSIVSHHPSPKNNSNAITSPINIFSPCPLPPKRLRECSTDSKGSEVTTSDRDSTENLCPSKHNADLSCDKKSPRSPKNYADRIRLIDEQISRLSQTSTTAMPATTVAAVPVKCDLPPTPTIDYSKYNIKKKSQVNQAAAGDCQRSEPSDIMKNLLSKSSIFDQDSKRLEHINEKYEPSKDTDPLSANRPMFRTKAAAKEFAPSNPEPDARRSSTSSSSSSLSTPVKGLACLSRKMSEPAKLPAAVVKKEASPTTPLSAPARSFSNSFTPFLTSNPVKQKDKEAVKCPVTDVRREGDVVRDPRTQKSDDVTSKISEKKPLIQKSHSMPSGSKNPSTQQQLSKSSESRAFGSETKRWSSSDVMDTDSEPVKGDSNKLISKQISNKSKPIAAASSSSSSSSKDLHSKSESGSCIKKDKSDVQKREVQLKLQEKAARKSEGHKSSPSKCKSESDRSHPKSEKSLSDKLLCKKEQDRKSLTGKNRSASESSGKKKEKLSAKQKELRKLGITEEPVYLSMYDKVKARSSANQSLPKTSEPAAKSKSKQSRKRDDDLSSDSDSDSSSGSVSEVERKRKRKRVIQSSSSSSSSDGDDSGNAAGPSKGCSMKSSPRSSAGMTNKSKSKSLIRSAVDSDSDSDECTVSAKKQTKVRRKGITGKKQAVLSSSSSSSSSDEADEEDEKDEDDDDDDDDGVPPRQKQQRKGLHKSSERVSVASDDQSPHEKRFPDHLHNKKTQAKAQEKKTEKELVAKRSKMQDRTVSSEKAASGAAAAEKQRESETTTSSKIKAVTDNVREKSHAAAHQPPPPASKSALCESSNKLVRKKNKSFLKEKERLNEFSSQHKKRSPDNKDKDSDRSLHHSDSSGRSPKKKKFKKEDSSSSSGGGRDKYSGSKSSARTADTLSSKHHRRRHSDNVQKRSSDSSDQDVHHSLIPSDLSDDADCVPGRTKTPAVISHTEWERSECGKVSSKTMADLSSANNRKIRKSSGSTDKHTVHDRTEKMSFEKIISCNDAAPFEKKHSDTMAEVRRVRVSSGSSDTDSNRKQKPKSKKLYRDADRTPGKDVLSFSCMAERKSSPPLVSSTSDNILSVLLKSPASSASPSIRDNVSESSEDMKLDRDLSEAALRTAEKAEHLESESSSDDLMISTGLDDVSCQSKNREDREQPQRSFEQEAAIETKRLEVELNQSWKSEPAHHFEGLICSTTSESIPQIVDEEPVVTPDPEQLLVVPDTELELHEPRPLVIESLQEKDGDGKDADHRRMEDDLAVSALLQEMDDSPAEQETGIEENPYLSIVTDTELEQQQPQPSLHISTEDLHPEPEQLKQAISSLLPLESKDSSAAHAPALEAAADPIPKSADEIQERNPAAAKETRKATPEPSADLLTAFDRSPVKRLSTETLPQTTVTPAVVSAPTIADLPKRLSRDAESAESTDLSDAAIAAKEGDAGVNEDETVSEQDERRSRSRKPKSRKSVIDPALAVKPAEKTEPLPNVESGTGRRRAAVEKIRRSPRVASLDPDPPPAPSDTHDELSGDEANVSGKQTHGEVSDHADDSDHNEQKKRRGRRKKVSGDSHVKPHTEATASPAVVPGEQKVPVRERLHVLLPSTDKPVTDGPKSLSPYNVFDFKDDDDESPPPLFFSQKTMKIADAKQIVPPASEEKKVTESVSTPAPAVPVAAISPVLTSGSAVTSVCSSTPSVVPVCSEASASPVATIAAVICEEIPQKVVASVPEAQDKREADKEKDAKYITELSGHGKLSMTIRIQKEGQADAGTAEIVKTTVKVPDELPKTAKPTESEADVVKATRKSARLMSQNKSTIDEVIEDVIKGKSIGESEIRLRRMQRSGRKSVDSAAAPDVSEDGDLSEDTESLDRNLRSYRLTRSSTRGSTGGEEADTADECSNPAPAQRRQSVKAAEVSDKVMTAEQKPPDESSASETPVIEPAVVSHPAAAAAAPASNMPAVTRKDAVDAISSQTCEVSLSLEEDAAPIEETPSDKLTKAELPAPVSHTPPTTTATTSSSVIQEPHRTPLVPSVSERIHNSTTAQKLKTGKGLEYLIEEPVVPEQVVVRIDDEKKHVAAAAVRPPPAHTKITIEAKQTSIVAPEKRSPVPAVHQVGHATRTQEMMHQLPTYGRDVEQNLPPHLTPQQQKDYLNAVQQQQQQEMAHRMQQEQRLAPVATPPPPASQVPAPPHHLRPMVMPVPSLPLHSEQIPYNMLMFPHPYGLHPGYLPPRAPGYGVPIGVDQKDGVRVPNEKEEQKLRSRAKNADELRIEQQHQQRGEFVADEETLKRLQMAPNQMRGIPYHTSRMPPHLLSPHERVSDSPVIPHSFIPRHPHLSTADHKGTAAEFQHSPIPKSDGDRKPGVPYPPPVTPGVDMARSFGIASPAPTYLDSRSVHPAAHSPGSNAFRPKVPSPICREDDLRKFHHIPYGKEMSSPVGMGHPAAGYHMGHHVPPGEHADGLLTRGHGQLPHDPVSRQSPVCVVSHAIHRPPSPPHAASQPPASGDSILLQRYPIVWQGLLALKNDQAAVQMHFVSGSSKIAHSSLPPVLADGPSPVRISQRMRLEQAQLEGVARKMQLPDEHCILLALPCGRDNADVLQQSNNLKSGFINYLQSKQAAGIVNSSGSGPQATSFVIHIFPSSEFSTDSMSRIAPDLLHGIADIAHLMIIIATV